MLLCVNMMCVVCVCSGRKSRRKRTRPITRAMSTWYVLLVHFDWLDSVVEAF